MNKKSCANALWLALLLLGTVWALARRDRPQSYRTDRGMAFGTLYAVTYQHGADLHEDIEQCLKTFDGSLSPFNDTAIISRVNRNETVKADTLFANVFRRSMEISRQTGGAFDITVAPLVNAWGFGFRDGAFPDSGMIDSLRAFAGYEKVRLTDDGYIEKQDPRLMLTCSAVAKGYGADVVAGMLSRRGVKNYMIDIGGEVVARGRNPDGRPWRIGISKPADDSLSLNQDLQAVLRVADACIATSGNYRNYYYREGKKYGHTIDPRTGYPVQHSILSATVIARDCMSADAYATAFMVMGLDKAKQFARNHPEIDAYFIYADSAGALRTFGTDGMARYLPAE